MRTPIIAPERGIQVASPVSLSQQGNAAVAQAGAALAAGVARVGDLAARVDEQRGAVYAAKAIADAKSQWSRSLIERQMSAEGEAAGFTQAVDRDFKEYASQALGMAPPRARDRMQVAFAEFGGRIVADAMAFEATRRVAYRGEMVKATIDQNRNTVVGNPDMFDEIMDDTLAAIEGAGLPDDVARKLTQEARADLSRSAVQSGIEKNPGGVYASLIRGDWDGMLDPDDKGRLISTAKAAADGEYVRAEAADVAQAMSPQFTGDAQALLREFEGFRSAAYYDVNAYRVGFGSDTVTRADGTVEAVTARTMVSREDAERDLARRTSEFAMAAREKVGAGAWDALPEPARAALTSIAYNYGSIPDRLVEAIQSGDTLAIADAVEGLAGDNNGVNRKRREREAAIIRASDPEAVLAARLQGVDDPVLRDRIAREAQAQYALDAASRERQAAAAALERESRKARLEVAVDRGEATFADIETAWAAGDLTAPEWSMLTRRRQAAQEAQERENRTINMAREKLAGGVWNVFDSDDRRMVDALWKASEQTPEVAIALTARTGIAPDGFIASLRAGLFAGDVETFTTAMQVRQAAPAAFRREGGAEIEKAVEEFSAFTALGYSAEDAVRRVRRTPEERRAAETAAPVIARELKGIEAGDVAGAFSGALPFTTPSVPEQLSPLLVSDYATLYRESRLDGLTESEARSVARQRIKRTWGVSRISGSAALVRHPVERYYPPIDGSHEWVAAQAMEDARTLGGKPVRVELIADGVTDTDIRAGQPPRYRLFWVDEDGTAQAAPGYFRADPSALLKAQTERRRAEFDARRAARARNGEVVTP